MGVNTKKQTKAKKKPVAVIRNKDVIQSYIMTTARYDFSADEKRILLKLVETWQHILEGQKLSGRVEKTLFGDYSLEFPISYFVPDNQTNYERIKKAFRALNEKKFEYEDDKIWEIIRIIEKPKIEKREKIHFDLNAKIVECFLNFTKGYRRFELEVSLSFSSVYAMRLYELLSGQTNPLSYTIEDLKVMFQIPDKYKETKDFIKRVIEPAKKELDEKSPYTFTYNINKKGRSYHSITFFPVYQPCFRNEDLETKDLQKKVSISAILDRNEKDYLIKNFEFELSELKQNYKLFLQAKESPEFHLINFVSAIKARALRAKNPKGYIINAIKKQINYDIQL